MTQKDVLDFWFGDQPDDAAVANQQQSTWWSKNPDIDKMIALKFSQSLEEAGAGDLSDWEDSAQGLLALIILVDQFSRNIYRGDPRCFSRDHLARRWCRMLIDSDMDQDLRPIERVFAYLPLEHSEDMGDQDKCLALFTVLFEQLPDNHRKTFKSYVDFAHAHRNIIVRFGRYPHRNSILGRQSTAQEREFLEQPGSFF